MILANFEANIFAEILCSKFIFPMLRETSTSRFSLPSIALVSIASLTFFYSMLVDKILTNNYRKATLPNTKHHIPYFWHI